MHADCMVMVIIIVVVVVRNADYAWRHTAMNLFVQVYPWHPSLGVFGHRVFRNMSFDETWYKYRVCMTRWHVNWIYFTAFCHRLFLHIFQPNYVTFAVDNDCVSSRVCRHVLVVCTSLSWLWRQHCRQLVTEHSGAVTWRPPTSRPMLIFVCFFFFFFWCSSDHD